MKHTPGPWRIDDRIDFVDGCLAVVDDGSVLCHVEVWPYEDEETQKTGRANARIIAAAPYLYEACKKIAELIEQNYPDMVGIDDVRHAIAKAEGTD